MGASLKGKRGRGGVRVVVSIAVSGSPKAVFESSWREMQVADPPIKRIKLEVVDRRWRVAGGMLDRIVQSEGGVTLGEFF